MQREENASSLTDQSLQEAAPILRLTGPKEKWPGTHTHPVTEAAGKPTAALLWLELLSGNQEAELPPTVPVTEPGLLPEPDSGDPERRRQEHQPPLLKFDS